MNFLEKNVIILSNYSSVSADESRTMEVQIALARAIMDKKKEVIKHLEMIQGVINRLGHDSFLIKGWSMAILAAGIIFITRNDIINAWIMLAFLVPVIGFWILDGYFLWQERLFREIYNDIRIKDSTDFSMNINKHKNKPKCNWLSSIFSVTLIIFYSVELLFVLVGYISLISLISDGNQLSNGG